MNKNKYEYYIKEFKSKLPLGNAFDLDEREICIGGVKGYLYYIDGLSDSEKLQILFNFLFAIPKERMEKISNADTFMSELFPYIKSETQEDPEKATTALYSGLAVILIEGFDKLILTDVRHYPSRSVTEPEKEKTLRGAKDGFTESITENVGLIRRRIRDNRLYCKNYSIGETSRTDVALCYMKGIADQRLVDELEKNLTQIKISSVSISDQTIVEQLLYRTNGAKLRNRLNPFPKVRYTQRPDVIASHLTEGKIAIVIDNSPTVVLLPVGIFDFLQDPDDYYFPLLTGNYMRALRIFNMIVILFLTPVYLLIVEGWIPTPTDMHFIVPDRDYALSVFWQFILLELAVDGLKLASLNTPDSLGMSLSVIGALLLGQVSIDSGWFIPQTILMMSVVALATFTQPSIELSYSIKLIRVMMLIGAMYFGVWGLVLSALAGFLILGFTKTLGGESYLYPLYPFYWPHLKKLLFRTTK